jgi:hypothetical protein
VSASRACGDSAVSSDRTAVLTSRSTDREARVDLEGTSA